MKLELLVANQAALKALSGIQFEDAQLAWDLADILEQVEAAVLKFQKQRDEFVKEKGKPIDGEEGKYSFEDPKGFEDKILKLLTVDVKVDFPIIPIIAFEGSKVSASEMLSWKSLGILERSKPKKSEK